MRNRVLGLGTALPLMLVMAGGCSDSNGKGGAGGSTGRGGAVGGGGSLDSGGSVTSLGGGRSLDSLSTAEATQLCDDTYVYYQRTISQAVLCKESGLASGVSSSAPSDAVLQQTCSAQEQACLGTPAAVAICGKIPAPCPMTVAQYSACVSDQAAAFNAGVAGLPDCATVTQNDLQGVWALVASDPPASCAAFQSTCGALDIPTPHPGVISTGGTPGSGGRPAIGTGGSPAATGGSAGGTGGPSGGTGGSIAGSGGTKGTGGSRGSVGSAGGSQGAGGAGGSVAASGLPGDVAAAAGTPFVAAHAMTRALFAAYTGPLFRALRTSDNQEKDITALAATGLVDVATLDAFCSGTSCKVTTLYDQSGNGNDLWRADDPNTNQPGTVKPCALMDIQYWQMSDGTKVPIAVETGAMWKSTAQCLRNRDKTKNMPTGSKPQTEYGIFHAQYLNNNCCFNYGNTGNAVHYSGPGTLSSLNFSRITFWSEGTGNGPWPMVDFETGVYAGNTAKCGSGVPSSVTCTSTGQNSNPSVTFDIVTTVFKHNGVNHWALKTGNAKAGTLSVNVDLASLPNGYSPSSKRGGSAWAKGAPATPTAPAASLKVASSPARRRTERTTRSRRASSAFTASSRVSPGRRQTVS